MSVGDTVVLTASGRLVSFNRAAPGTEVGAIGVVGLAAGETLVGIDYRPADSLLYALASSGKVYTVDPSTGVATLKSTLKAAAGDDSPFTALAGTRFGVDFNPAADRLRVVSDTGQSLRINVDTGVAITDRNIALAGGSAQISASAYTNAFAGADRRDRAVLAVLDIADQRRGNAARQYRRQPRVVADRPRGRPGAGPTRSPTAS